MDEVHVDDLTPRCFREEFWARNRPCVIRDAVEHTKAYDRWGSIDYLKRELGNPHVLAYCKPPIENGRNPRDDQVQGIRKVIKDPDAEKVLPLQEFLDLISSRPYDPIWLYSNPLPEELEETNPYAGELRHPKPEHPELVEKWKKLDTGAGLYPLGEDLTYEYPSCFPFLRDIPYGDQRFRYFVWRAFLYRKSLTDWHSHPSDSHLVCQFRGSKHVAMAAPNEGFDKIWPVVQQLGHTYEADEAEFPTYFDLDTYRTELREGDALYIPIYWWHNIIPSHRDWGMTGVYTWRAPFHVNADWHFENTQVIWDAVSLPGKLGMVPLIGWSKLYRTWKSTFSPDAEKFEWRHDRK